MRYLTIPAFPGRGYPAMRGGGEEGGMGGVLWRETLKCRKTNFRRGCCATVWRLLHVRQPRKGSTICRLLDTTLRHRAPLAAEDIRMITCDVCDETIQKHEELCITPDWKHAHPACFGRAIRVYLAWANGNLVDFDAYKARCDELHPEDE